MKNFNRISQSPTHLPLGVGLLLGLLGRRDTEGPQEVVELERRPLLQDAVAQHHGHAIGLHAHGEDTVGHAHHHPHVAARRELVGKEGGAALNASVKEGW